MKQGQGRYAYVNGNKFTGYWNNGLPHGEGMYYFDGNIDKGIWENDIFISR